MGMAPQKYSLGSHGRNIASNWDHANRMYMAMLHSCLNLEKQYNAEWHDVKFESSFLLSFNMFLGRSL